MPPGRKAQKRKQKKNNNSNNSTNNNNSSSSVSPNPPSPEFNGHEHEEISAIEEEIRAEKEWKSMEEDKVLKEVTGAETEGEIAETTADTPAKTEIISEEGEKETGSTSIPRDEEDKLESETEIVVTNEDPTEPSVEKEDIEIEREVGVDTEKEIEREVEEVDTEKEVEREVEEVDTEKEVEREVEEVDTEKEIEREVEVVEVVKESQSAIGAISTPELVEPVLQERETQKVVQISAPENLNICAETEQHSEVQVAGCDLPVGVAHRATWWNCCGIFDVFSRSN